MQFREIKGDKVQCLVNYYDPAVKRGRQKLIYTFDFDHRQQSLKPDHIPERLGTLEERQAWASEISAEMIKYAEIARKREAAAALKALKDAASRLDYIDHNFGQHIRGGHLKELMGQVELRGSLLNVIHVAKELEEANYVPA